MTATLHVINGLDTGGAETNLVQLAGSLLARGLSQHVVSLGGRGTFADDLEKRGIPVSALGIRSAYGGPRGIWQLVRLVGLLRPRVIQGWLYHGDLMAALAHKLAPGRRQRRLFWNLRASNMDMARYGRTIRLCAMASAWPDIVVANSQAGAAFHIALGYRPRRLEVIRNGVDSNRFAPNAAARRQVREELGIDANAVVAIHVARVDPMKDHATFYAAMAQATNVIGLSVGRCTEQFTLPSNVRALGPRNDVERLYAGADIVVSSSAFGEGFSNTIAEGMSAGLVPIATDVGDVRYIVGATGHIVPARNSAALAAAIMAEAALPAEHRLDRGLAARMRIVDNFRPDQAADAFARLYLEA